MVADIGHQWGGDLEIGASGDLAVVVGHQGVQQRVLRRLLTNPGAYIWNVHYGAGLPNFIGTTASRGQIEAVVRSQIMREAAFARSPGVEITVSDLNDPEMGTFEVNIRYESAVDKQQSLFSIPITG